MKAFGLVALAVVLAVVLAGGWWLWSRVGIDVALGAVLMWCG